jgi:hypothetical protein
VQCSKGGRVGELLWLRHGDSSGILRKGNVAVGSLWQETTGVDIGDDTSLCVTVMWNVSSRMSCVQSGHDLRPHL